MNRAQKCKNELLIEACKEQRKETVEFLIERGADANYVDDEGYSPLWEASNNSDEEIIKLLLECGADPNACKADVTPLHIASDSPFRSLEAVAMLVSYGADVDKKDKQGETPYDRSRVADLNDEIEQSYISNFLKSKTKFN